MLYVNKKRKIDDVDYDNYLIIYIVFYIFYYYQELNF